MATDTNKTRMSDANSSGLVLSCGLFHWALVHVAPINLGWRREFPASDVVYRRVFGVAPPLIAALSCSLRTDVSFISTLHPLQAHSLCGGVLLAMCCKCHPRCCVGNLPPTFGSWASDERRPQVLRFAPEALQHCIPVINHYP